MKYLSEFFLLLAAILISFVLFLPTLGLALFGDDWLAIWYYTVAKANGASPITYFFSRYGSQEMMMWGFSKIFGYEGTIYYAVSFLLKTLAGLSLYPVIYYFTKNKTACFFAVLAFLTTFIGLEATNWVFNMNVYLAIAFMNFSIYFQLISRTSKTIRPFVFSLLFFYLSYIIAPSRVTLFIIPVFTIDFLWGVRQKKLKFVFKHQIFFVSLFVAARFVGNHGINSMTTLISENISAGKYSVTFIKRLLTVTGGFIIPSGTVVNRLHTVLGIIFFVSLSFLFYKYKSEKRGELALLSLLTVITAMATPMLIWPDFLYTAEHRHLLLAAPGVAMLVGLIIDITHKNVLKLAFILSITLTVVVHIYSINTYLSHLTNTRSEILENKIWNQLRQVFPDLKQNESPLTFYFESDNQSQSILSDLVYFGFPSKMSVLYNLDSYHYMPSVVTQKELLKEVLEKGRTLDGKNYQKVPLENIYAYRLENKTKIINITQKIREQLK